MYSESYGAAVQGIDGCMIQIEVDISDGLPCFMLVGYLSAEVKEARERVRIALKNSGYRIPPKKITINLSPADMRKDGTGYDLSIAVAILAAFGYMDTEALKDAMFIGELSLDGRVKGVNGVLPMVYTAFENGVRYCFVPSSNISEAMMVQGIRIISVSTLKEVVDILQSGRINDYVSLRDGSDIVKREETDILDFIDVRGQSGVKRAVEVAVSGMHNLLMVGAPGTGKTMIAQRIPGIMPGLDFSEQMNISKVYSVSGMLSADMPVVEKRPFRAPHHTITQTALVGGGRYPKPGEISLASGGVLFLDELPEFQRQTLEVLRQPLEEGYVNVSRLDGAYRYPARCQLVAAMNPCRCGYYPDKKKCTCTPLQIKNYLGKISQPLLDRIDICTETLPLKYADIGTEEESTVNAAEMSENIRRRVEKVQNIQRKRYQDESINFNAQLESGMIDRYCVMTDEARIFIKKVFDKFEFSARAYHKILKVGRTIADMDESDLITKRHISEAVCYRITDKKYWGMDV